MSRRALPWIALVALPGLLAAALQWGTQREVERTLRARGLAWQSRSARIGGATWRGLTGDGVAVDRLDVALAPWPAVSVTGAAVDLASVDLASVGGGPAGGGAAEGGLASRLAGLADVPVSARDLTVRWGEEELLSGLSGSVRPRLVLDGADGFVRQGADGLWAARLERSLAFGPARADLTFDLQCADRSTCRATAQAPTLTLTHELLAPGPVVLDDLRLTADLDLANQTAEGEARVGGLRAAWSLDAERRLTVDASALPVDALVDALAPWIPEAAVASAEGTVGAVVEIDLPARAVVRLEPQAEGLAAEGVIPNPAALRGGALTWRAPLEDGAWVPRTTGDGLPGWTPLSRAGLAPQAMIYAEDAAFASHNGVHLPAIREAVDQWLADPEQTLRGGSTITQQLAKNLYCDPLDRTLARKLRELLYALELERTLPKRRILELYINIVELGPELYGVGPAADAYFLKQPGRLTATEAVFLAALLPSPRRGYARAAAGRPPRARMSRILDNMVKGGVLSAAEAAEAQAAALRIVPLPR